MRRRRKMWGAHTLKNNPSQFAPPTPLGSKGTHAGAQACVRRRRPATSRACVQEARATGMRIQPTGTRSRAREGYWNRVADSYDSLDVRPSRTDTPFTPAAYPHIGWLVPPGATPENRPDGIGRPGGRPGRGFGFPLVANPAIRGTVIPCRGNAAPSPGRAGWNGL